MLLIFHDTSPRRIGTVLLATITIEETIRTTFFLHLSGLISFHGHVVVLFLRHTNCIRFNFVRSTGILVQR